MRRIFILGALLAMVSTASASWYWPFGSDHELDGAPRVSTLMAPASALIDKASDLVEDGKTSEAVETYRAALRELDRIERENPERAKTTEFATVRNKRAYVNAAIDSLLLGQVKANAKAVAVSDTTELEQKLAKERAPKTPRGKAMAAIAEGDFKTAQRLIDEMLKAKPDSALALNLKGTMEARQGKFKEAGETFYHAATTNPRSHFAYYNLALLTLQMNPDSLDVARRYYETGRAVGGPKDPYLEALTK